MKAICGPNVFAMVLLVSGCSATVNTVYGEVEGKIVAPFIGPTPDGGAVGDAAVGVNW